MTTDDLTTALRAYAGGLLPLEAGVSLLVSNGTFLQRDDFTSRFIEHGISICDGTSPMAAIDWDAAITALHVGELPCSGGFSELKTIMNITWSGDFPGCAADGRDQELNVAVVEAGEGVPEIDGDAVGHACRNFQHPLLASGTWKA